MLRFFAFIMLCCIVLDSAGFYLVQMGTLLEVSREMKQKANAAQAANAPAATPRQLSVLRLKSSEMQELQWHEHDREFRFRGQMYDVVRMAATADGMIIECLPDDDETKTLEQIALFERQREQSPQSSAPIAPVFEKFSGEYLFPTAIECPVAAVSDVFFGIAAQSGIRNHTPDVTSPPPRT